MGITDDKHCEILAASIRDHNTRMVEGFKLFVQMFSVVAGGALVLRFQRTDASPPIAQFAWLADLLIVLVCFASALIIIDSFIGGACLRWPEWTKSLRRTCSSHGWWKV